MHKVLSSLACAGLFLLSCLAANKVDAHENTKDNYFTVASLSITPVYISNDVAFSLLAEAGSKSDRINGTLGFFADECNRFKISAEYLSQRLHYKFFTGKEGRWVHQYAFGGTYQHLFGECSCCLCGIQLGFDYSHSINKSLSDKNFDINSLPDDAHLGTPQEEGTLFRNIAGAWSWEVDAGVLICPWRCATFIPSIVYQQVTYTRHLEDKKRLSGVGFNIAFKQRLYKNVSFDLLYQFRQAYNDFRGSINWNKCYCCGALGLGVFVDHVYGKRNLPSSTTTGIELNFAFGVDCCLEKVSLQSSCGADCSCDPCYCCAEDILDWVRDPAVYMPEVLAIVDQQKCFVPSDNFPIDPFTFNSPPNQAQIDFNDYFNVEGNDEIYYVIDNIETTGDVTTKFDKDSGILFLSFENTGAMVDVDLTAYNDCGNESTSFEVDINLSPP